MAISRRKFLTFSSTACLILMPPIKAWAVWSSAAFYSKNLDEAYRNLFGSTELIESYRIKLKVPKIANNREAVPISVKTSIKNVESISLFVKDNPQPLAASFQIPLGTLPELSTRIRLEQASTVTVVIKSDGKLFSKNQKVKLATSDCPG